jgi:protocatechuate 3,4-dioxygenase beta subunit
VDVSLVPTTATVTGVVLESVDEDPLVGARVELLRKGWGLMATTATADDGSFAFTAPPADAADYQVRVFAEDYYTLTQPFALAPGGRKEFTGMDRFVLVKNTPGMYSSDLEGTVTDDQGQPLGGARVTLRRPGDGDANTVISQGDGTFRLDSVNILGRTGYVLEAEKEGYFTAAETYPDTNLDTKAHTLRLRPATAQLRGRVADTWGAPLAGVTVTAGPSMAMTDANGIYQLNNLPAGPADAFFVRATGIVTRTVTAAEGPIATAGLRSRTVDLQGVANAAVSGVVVGVDGRALAGVSVQLWHEGESAPVGLARSADDGNYSFTGLIPGDRYTVLAVPDMGRQSSLVPGEASVTPLFKAVAGSTRQLDLGLGQ